jgi:hypothetical protein
MAVKTRRQITDRSTGAVVGWFDEPAALNFGHVYRTTSGRWVISADYATGFEEYPPGVECDEDGPLWEVYWFATDAEAKAALTEAADDGLDEVAEAATVALDAYFPSDRGAGRPAIGPIVKTRLPSDVLSALDAWAAANGLDRSAAIRHIIEDANSSAGLASFAFDLSAEEIEAARRALDGMLAQWNMRGVRLSYAMGADPDTESG